MSTVSSVSSQLDPYLLQLINNIMTLESQPVTLLNQQKDTLSVQKAIYKDLKDTLDAFQNSARALLSSNDSYGLAQSNKVAVSNIPTGSTVISATAGSTAIPGTYNLDVTQLARQHRVRSDLQAFSNQALGLSGTFKIGGLESRTIVGSTTTANTVVGFEVANPASGQTGIGSGDFYVETRHEGGWQFRLVDADGNPISIRQGNGTTYTSNWQSIPTDGAAYDTGRGLKITFGSDAGQFIASNRLTGAASVDYRPEGATITVSGSESLNDIANAINNAKYAEGSEVEASVVNNRLVLQSKRTGEAHILHAVDVGSSRVLKDLGIFTEANDWKNYDPAVDSAKNALFKINGVDVERASNLNLSDVVTGLTLNLAADAAGKTATLTVSNDISGGKTAIQNFLTKFNSLISYLKQKTAITKNEDETYTRGALSGDMMFRSLNAELQSLFNRDASNSGIYANLRAIGLGLNDSMEAVITDSSKLEAALTSNMSDVKALFEVVMSRFDAKMSMYTGDTGYLGRATKATEDQITSLTDRVKTLNDRLEKRRLQLIDQYAQLQAQMSYLTYQQQQVSYLNTLFNGQA